jgi:uncharacterized protein
VTASSHPAGPGAGPPTGPARAPLDVREARAATMIVHAVPADHVDAFVAWQHAVAEAAAAFAGYQGTELYPPVEGTDDWVIVIQFDDHAALHAWLDSPTRAELLATLPEAIQPHRLETMPAGFGSWVADVAGRRPRIPHWKSFLLVLIGLYPTVMVLSIVLSPRTEPLGLALAVLVGNVVSVAFLEWVGMPALNRLLGPWLRAGGRDGRIITVVGLLGIVVALFAIALGFRLLVG